MTPRAGVPSPAGVLPWPHMTPRLWGHMPARQAPQGRSHDGAVVAA